MSTWEQITIYVGESDQWHGKPLYMALVEQARQQGIVGATVTRGVVGFGNHSKIHTTQLFELSSDLPMVVTMIDNPQAIAAFLPIVKEMVKEGLVISQSVTLVHHLPTF
jgi:PII-like signaling protein